jgi:two-component system NarL family sensor kinase
MEGGGPPPPATSAGSGTPRGGAPQRLTLADLLDDPGLSRVLLDHALLGIRVQFILRAALLAFLVATAIAVPPAHYRVGCYVIVGLYALWSAGLFWLFRGGGVRVVRMIWVTLGVDVAALGVFGLVAAASENSWTTDVLVTGFFVVPMLATAQLRPAVGAAVTVPTVGLYLGSLIAARHANGEPWSGIFLQASVLAVLSVGCVALSWVQRSRVLMIAGLIGDRGELTSELVDVERTARRDLAEELHDGALQYILAARQDLEDARERQDPESFDRIEHALRESTELLRAKVGQLHPAVLEQAGLRRALEDLTNAATRDGQSLTLNCEQWEFEHTDADELLYGAARELLANVAKHARAQNVSLTLHADEHWLTLTVADDGVGIADGALERRLSAGHVGMASQRTRIEVAGGRFEVRDAHPGTIVVVALPSGLGR